MTKKFVFMLATILLVGMLLTPISGQDDDNTTFVSAQFDSATLSLSDGAISTEWDNITYFQSLTEFGQDGFVKFANNESHIFSLWKVESSYEWVAIEFGAGAEFCMVRGNDGWTFYIDQTTGEVEVYDEIYDGASGPPAHDVDEGGSDDVSIEAVEESGYHFIEVVRAVDTSDDKDMILGETDEPIQVKFASSSNHYTGGAGDNPTEFGPSTIYFLSVQFGGGDIAVPTTPDVVDYEFWKKTILVAVLFMVAGFITTHFLVRQVFKPVSHPPRIVHDDFERPTIKSRWESVTEDNQTRTPKEV